MAGELDDVFSGAEADIANAPEKIRLEAKRQSDARKAAEADGWKSYKWSSPRHGGVLDVIYMKPVRIICFVEYKQPGNGPTDLQQVCMNELSECGFPRAVCYDTEDTLEFLRYVESLSR